MFRLRRFTSFSLRTALIAVTVFGVWLGLHFRSVKRQRASVEAVQRYGGWVCYDYEVGADYFTINPRPSSPVPAWLLKTFGRDHFHEVVYVNMIRLGDSSNQSSKVLSHLEGLPKLKSLHLYRGQATDEGLKHVGRLKSLRRLTMVNAHLVSDAGVAHLSSLGALEYLHLDKAGITDESLQVFARLPKLHTLLLERNQLTDHGLAYLQSMMQLRQLGVGLSENHITDDGLAHVQRLTQLESLDLRQCQVTEVGLRHLVGLRSLKDLRLDETQVRDVSWLQQQLPNCKISYTTGVQFRPGDFTEGRLFERINFAYGFSAGVRGIKSKSN